MPDIENPAFGTLIDAVMRRYDDMVRRNATDIYDAVRAVVLDTDELNGIPVDVVEIAQSVGAPIDDQEFFSLLRSAAEQYQAGLRDELRAHLRTTTLVATDAELTAAEAVAAEIRQRPVVGLETGRDAVWPNALSATAMRTVETCQPEQFLLLVTEHGLRVLAGAVNGQPRPQPARPYLSTAGITAKEPVPQRWVAQPIGRFGPLGRADSDVVYNPRRFDVTVIGLGDHHSGRRLKAENWERYDADRLHALWIYNRIEAARTALALDQKRATGRGPRGPRGPREAIETPARELDL